MTTIPNPAISSADAIDMANLEAIWQGAVELNTRARMGQQIQISKIFVDAVLLLYADVNQILSAQQGMHVVTPVEQKATAVVEKVRQEKETREKLYHEFNSLALVLENFSATLRTALKAKDAPASRPPEQATVGGKPKAKGAGRVANADH